MESNTATLNTNPEPALSWYTKDLMVEETSSPQLSLSPSPVSSPSLLGPSTSGARASPPTLTTSLVAPSSGFAFQQPRPRVASSSALLSVPSEDDEHKQRGERRQPKRRRSISDSLVPAVSKMATEEADDEDELIIEEFSNDENDHDSGRNPDVEDGASDDVEESGEDDDQADDPDIGSSPRVRQGGMQGHESGPPSPPAGQYQHGMIENPDGTAFYHCKFCQQTWPQSHFRNAQQFGAHCSNCSRKRKVKDPQDMTTTTRERNKRMRKVKRSRSISASKSSLDETRHKLIDSEDSSPESQESPSPRKFRRPHSMKSSSSGRHRLLPREPSSPRTGMGGMDHLFGAMAKREDNSGEPPKKNIFALLAYVKSELARIREQEDSEELELTAREMVQDARTEWAARIQELRVEAMSDLRAHTASLPRRVDRLASLHPAHKDSPAPATRNSLGFILNDSSKAEPSSIPAWTFSGNGARSTAAPAPPPPSPVSAARQQKTPSPINGRPSQTPAFNVRSPAPFVSGPSCVPPSTSPIACASPLPTLL